MNAQFNRRTLLLLLGIFAGATLTLALFLWWHQPHHPGRVEVSPFENDMMERVVRAVLREGAVRQEPVCFIAFGEGTTTPSSTFIARFADCRRPAVRGVGGSVSPPINRSLEKDNGRRGLLVHILKFEPFISGVFDVTVSLSNLPAGHDRIVYRIADTGGEWVIRKRTAS